MALKIGKLTRELNVGSAHIVDFLHKKGFTDIEDDLNQRITDEQYDLLVAEFSKDKSLRDAADKFQQERLQQKRGGAEPEPAVDHAAEKAAAERAAAEKVAAEKAAAEKAAAEKAAAEKAAAERAAAEKAAAERAAAEKAAAERAAAEKAAAERAAAEKAAAEKAVAERAAAEKAAAERVSAEKVAQTEKTAAENDSESQDNTVVQTAQGAGLNLQIVGKIDLNAINQSTRPKKKTKEEKKKEREQKEQQRKQFTQRSGDNSQLQNANSGEHGSEIKKKKNRIKVGGKEKIDSSNSENFGYRQNNGQFQNSGNNNGGAKGQDKNHKDSKDYRHSKYDRNESNDEDINRQIRDTFSKMTTGAKTKSSKYRKEKRDAVQNRRMEMEENELAESKVLKLTEFVTANELATMMNVAVTQVIGTCMSVGIMVSINQRLDAETIKLVADEFGFTTDFVSSEVAQAVKEEADKPEDLVPRAPIVTVMGHVDHGKTSLLDNIRNTNVIAGEAGGITQHIGAYNVKLQDGRHITFLDTPGHEAFTAMRARGAQVTDIAIIIVAADDDVMPQTKEAIAHAQAANVPMVFAINKIDKPAADAEKIKQQLASMNLLVEDWGGKYQSQDISAKKGIGVPELMEKVLLEAEMLDLKANPNRNAVGSIIESSLDKGRGYVATVLVQNGTLKIGDIVVAGTSWGKVRAMFNERNQKMKQAAPAEPALILGLNGAPQAGVTFNVVESEREAREITSKREQLQREQGLRTTTTLTLDEIGRRISQGEFHELNLIVKGDVDGSVEALSDSLIKLSTDKVQVNVIHKAVGAISESDVSLAAASNQAIIIGFDVRPTGGAKRLAEQQSIDIRLYSIIYDAIEEVKSAMEGLLKPKVKEEVTSTIEVMEVFHISKVGMVAGTLVRDGKVKRTDKARLIRDGIVIFKGDIQALKRFKDDAKEVAAGLECGISLVGCNDIKVGDIIETFAEIEIKQTL
ncbi:MAG: translation initiation factor IF-2 [Bacteroidaceae bacterium]|nr:translation initiation factor IF-2 [Bacteroidaceae bacterium]